jgi:PAS domain-containing protein
VEGRRQKHLALILARELATQLATATFIADADGGLVFYNESAEEILGRGFAEAGSMSAESWASLFQVEDADGRPLPLEERPTHGQIRIRGLDGRTRSIAVTALPLFSTPTDLVGVMALFWEES